jgi:hypothetical protein
MNEKQKRPRDANQLAKFIVDTATGKDPEYESDTSGQRKGGQKGGKARAESLEPKIRSSIAKKAADRRWSSEEK